MKLTVFFEGEWWLGIVEEVRGGKLRAVRHVFGAEPYDAEVMEFVQREMIPRIEAVSQSAYVKPMDERRINPKRLARQAGQEIKRVGASDAAKDSLMRELEHRKKVRRVETHEMREAEKERKREIAVQKAKQKHRGR